MQQDSSTIAVSSGSLVLKVDFSNGDGVGLVDWSRMACVRNAGREETCDFRYFG